MKILLPLIILACSLAAFGQTATISVTKATLRTRPNEKAPVVAALRKGAKIRLLPVKSAGTWSRVSFGKKTGWVRTETFYIKNPQPPRMVMGAIPNYPVNADTSGIGSADPPFREPIRRSSDPFTIMGGVVNGKAISLPKPPYPPAARAVHATGAVSVQVLIDESGRVISATAVSGHPLLRHDAVTAAQSAQFSPTVLSGQPVKVSGIITYNFVP